MSSKPISSFLLGMATLVLLSGCASISRFPPSPYSAHYNAGLPSFRMPDASAIHDVGVSWTFSRSANDVWGAIIKVVHQYEGVLDLSEDASGERRLLVIHGQPMFFQVSSFAKNRGMVASKHLDTWMAIAVIPGDSGKQTTVSVTWVSPKTGNVAPLEGVKVTEAIAGEEGGVDADRKQALKKGGMIIDASEFRGGAAPNLDAIVSSLSDERHRVVAALATSENADVRWQLVPRATINEFFYHLATQLYGPPRWREKFVTATKVTQSNGEQPAPSHETDALQAGSVALEGVASIEQSAGTERGRTPRSGGPSEAKDVEKITDTGGREQLVFEAGQWTSASLRRNLLVVDGSPPLNRLLEDTIHQIKKAANRSDLKVTPYIVASPQINAFAVPNGDVFITSGLIEAVDSEDELAAVVAHELDHLFQHDSTTFLLNRESAVIRTQAIGIFVAFVGGVAGAVVAAPTVAASGAVTQASVGSQIMGNVLSQTISSAGLLAGQHLGATMIAGHSQDAELRADRNAARYLWASGYDTGAFVKVLERLKELKVAAEKRKEVVLSGFINAQPGLDARIGQTREVVKTFGGPK